MKKVLLITLLLSMFSGGYALATTVNGQWNGLPIVKITSQGQAIESDSPAVILKDRTYVPLSALKSLGVQLVWDSSKYSVEVALPKPETIIKVVHELTQAQLDEIAKSVSIVYAVDGSLYSNSHGSGFLLNNGLFLTNDHVGSDNKEIQYYLNGKTFNNHGEIYFHDKTEDIYAVKNSETNGLKFTTKLPEVSEPIYAISYPKGKLAITKGSVTGIVNITGRTMIEFDAPIDDGSSGGALIDSEGLAIGIITSGFTGTNKNQALPLSYMEDELNKLK